MQVWTFLAYLVAAALFITGIRRLRRPETARSGNTIAAVGMVIALVATIFVANIDEALSTVEIGVGVLVGSVIGAVAAQRVQMTAMPQMVAAFNGVGGAAAALIAVSEFYRVEALGSGQEPLVSAIAVLLSVVIGTISFSGSTRSLRQAPGARAGRLCDLPAAAGGERPDSTLHPRARGEHRDGRSDTGRSLSPLSRSTSSSARRYFWESFSSYPSAGPTCPS